MAATAMATVIIKRSQRSRIISSLHSLSLQQIVFNTRRISCLRYHT
jgi:hypothetical protein